MTYNELTEQEGLDKEKLNNILHICSFYNSSLEIFRDSFKLEEVPVETISQFLEAYNNSQINLKTSQIISPSIELSKIKVAKNPPIFQYQIFDAPENKSQEDNYDIYLICSSSNGTIIHEMWNAETQIKGINIYFKKDIPNKTLKKITPANAYITINTFKINPKIDSIRCYIYSKNNAKFKEFILKSYKNGGSLREDNIAYVLEAHKNVLAFELYFNNNQWNSLFLGIGTKKRKEE